jgi:hypothetical protein
MKPCAFLAFLCLTAAGCSLITVPVKTAGSIVTTTVKTTGDIVTAPFDAVGRSREASEADAKKEEELQRPPASYLDVRPAEPVQR